MRRLNLIKTICIVEYGIEFIDKKLKIDDPVGASGVHGICGAVGTIAVGFLATDGGLFYNGGFELLAVQLIGVIAIAAWTMGTTFVLFKAIDATVGLKNSSPGKSVKLNCIIYFP